MAVTAIAPRPLPASVLLVDHDPDIVDLLRRTLAVEGYRILATSSATDAMWLVENDHVDLVIADAQIPGCGGVDLVVGVRRSNPSVIRILITATPSLDTAVRAINEGEVHRYLTKPWNPAALRTMIRDALTARLVRTAQKLSPPGHDTDLSPRLQQTLDALMTGASEKQVATQLGISPHTAHQYVKALFRKFGVTSRPELMARVLRR